MHIGLFDSGVGGLTVLTELRKAFPLANFSYLGDTARLPYGNKAPETLLRYTIENMNFLDSLQVDAIVVACHSASSVVLNEKKSPNGTPLYNVITPSCQEAIDKTKNKTLGIMATKATTSSQVYPSHINSLDSSVKVISQACPLLVPLVEEGLIQDEITKMALKRYIAPLKQAQVDCIVLGCTHYPILKSEIAKLCGREIELINPAVSVAKDLQKLGLQSQGSGQMSVYLTDHAPHFLNHAQSLLGETADMQFLSVPTDSGKG